MAKYQIGDKVKFLNNVGGGTVVRIVGDQIFVEDETGFEVPMAPNELIRMADMTGAGKLFNQEVGGHLPSLEEVRRIAAEEVRAEIQREEKERQLRAKYTGSEKAENIDAMREEIKRLQAQNANLRDQISKLQFRLSQIQKSNIQDLHDNILLQYMIAPGYAEVDLHIEALHDHPEHLSSDDMLNVQMSFFRTCITQGFFNHIKKITFIHGVGHGVLKLHMQRELDKYDTLSYMDAPMSIYGMGATEVYFKTV